MCRYVDALHDLSDVIIVRLTAILISRFLLNLQAADQNSFKLAQDSSLYASRMADSEDSERGVGSLVFAGFDAVGSLGVSRLASREYAGSCFGMEIDQDGSEEGRGENAVVQLG